MAGTKTEMAADLNAEHIGLLNSVMEKYDIRTQDKALRIIMDYMIVTPGIHDEVFTEVRCLRCE